MPHSKDKGRHGEQLTTRSRAVMLRAMDIVDQDPNRTMAQLVADAARDNPLLFMEKLARYLPKDMNVNHSHEGMVALITAMAKARGTVIPADIGIYEDEGDSPATH